MTTLLHNLLSALPASAPQWIGAAIVLLLHFWMTRSTSVKANNFVEAIANSLMAIPVVGALFQSVPVLGMLLRYLGTPSVAPAPVADTPATPPPTPPAAALLPFLTPLILKTMIVLSVVTCTSCAAGKQYAIDTAVCAKNKIPSDVMNQVTSLLSNGMANDDQVESDLEALGIKAGWDVVSCAVQMAILDFTHIKAAGKATFDTVRAEKRGQTFLKTAKQKMAEAAKAPPKK